ncbi:MAG: 30S ribosome-binding factor RbfA [Tissierellia bacterium]|nr:30S ribosome-binding factor RbfA [Tissierellia bacterium]
MDNKRTRRIEQELKREISSILANDIKDPRVSTLASITAVDMTRDLQFAKVFVSTIGDDQEKEDIIEGLKNATGFIKRELGARLNLRHVPELTFHLDESIERGMYMGKLINDVLKQDEENRKKYGNEE